MKANEFSKSGLFRTKYALGISLVPNTDEKLKEDLNEAFATLQGWRSDRGGAGDMVMFTLMLPPVLESTARDLIGKPHLLQPAFKGVTDGLKVEINVHLVDPSAAPAPEPKEPDTPCPKCSKPLRSARAKQCPHCGADWH